MIKSLQTGLQQPMANGNRRCVVVSKNIQGAVPPLLLEEI